MQQADEASFLPPLTFVPRIVSSWLGECRENRRIVISTHALKVDTSGFGTCQERQDVGPALAGIMALALSCQVARRLRNAVGAIPSFARGGGGHSHVTHEVHGYGPNDAFAKLEAL